MCPICFTCVKEISFFSSRQKPEAPTWSLLFTGVPNSVLSTCVRRMVYLLLLASCKPAPAKPEHPLPDGGCGRLCPLHPALWETSLHRGFRELLHTLGTAFVAAGRRSCVTNSCYSTTHWRHELVFLNDSLAPQRLRWRHSCYLLPTLGDDAPESQRLAKFNMSLSAHPVL